MLNAINYIFKKTLSEIIIAIYSILDFLLFDLTIFTPVRAMIASLFWKIGKKTRLRKGFVVTHLRNLEIGNNCYINRNNLFNNGGKITIGSNCTIGFDNKFLTVNHIEKDKVRSENNYSFYYKNVQIGDNVWITTNCVILPGSVIEDNVIVTPNSVVKGTLLRNWIYGGNPLKKVRKTEGIMPKLY